MTSQVVAIIEARMSSSRLPGKVLAPIQGVPVLKMILDRLRRCERLEKICVATTGNMADDHVADLAAAESVAVFRGSESDVLGRVLQAAEQESADVIVEVTGDCPFVDPKLVDRCVDAYTVNAVDLVSTCIRRTFPRGLDLSVFATKLLKAMSEITQDAGDREHVSLYLYEHPGEYVLYNVHASPELDHPEWRWTIDTAADLIFARSVVRELGHGCTPREMAALVASRPDLAALNSAVQQKPVR